MTEHNEDPAARRGWSISRVELLVVVSVIGVLFALVLPAVRQVRTAARRTQSSNNLRQIALAALNFESAHLRFPAGENHVGNGAEAFGWALAIVPFIESNNLYARVDGHQSWDSLGNSFVVSRSLPFYVSPFESKQYNVDGYGVLHYAACSELVSGGEGLRPDADFDRSQFLFGEICDGYEPWAKPGSCRMFGKGIRFDAFTFGSPVLDGALMARADGAIDFVASDVSRPTQAFQGKIKQGESRLPDSHGYELTLAYSPTLEGWRANCWFAQNTKGYGGGKALTDEGLKQLVQNDELVALILGGAHEVSGDGLKSLAGTAITRLTIGNRRNLEDNSLKSLHGMKQLRYLSLGTGEFADESVEELKRTLPECDVVIQ